MIKVPSFANYLKDASINVAHYLSDLTGATNQDAEWTLAVNHANLTGTNLYIPAGTTIYLTGIVNIPTETTVIGNSDLTKNVYSSSAARESTILLSSTAYIRMDQDSTLRGVRVLSKNAYDNAGGASDAPAFFEGTGVFIDHSDCTIENCMIAGFTRGIDSGATNGTGRTLISNVNMDNLNGMRLYNSLDTSRIENVQMWPFYSSTTPANNYRSGSGFDFITSDWTRVTGCFTWGYGVGFKFQTSTLNLLHRYCGSDIDASISVAAQSSRGIQIEAQYARNVTISGFQAGQMEYGILTFLGDGTGQKSTISVVGGSYIKCKYSLDFQGNAGTGPIVNVTGALIQPYDNVTAHPLGSSFGIRVVEDDSSCILTQNTFHNMTAGQAISVHATPAAGTVRVLGPNIYINVTDSGDGT